jgi:hypothetical protein
VTILDDHPSAVGRDQGLAECCGDESASGSATW